MVIPNFLPFLALVVISIIIFIISWVKASNKRVVPFFLCIIGLIFLFEYVILVIFKSYEYYPEIFSNNYFDNILGANISNGFIVPSVAVLIAVFNLGFWWIIFIILGFACIEELFLHLDIYQHFWWKTIYTSIGMLINFYLGKWIWRLIQNHLDWFQLRFSILYFTNVAIQGTLTFYLAALFELFIFNVNWFEDPIRGHFAFITLYFFIDSIIYSLLVVKRVHCFGKPCSFLAYFVLTIGFITLAYLRSLVAGF
ncbi:MAG TPA: hypothetical protein VKZ77_08945 [Bacillaceae bacterium]|nr:hypothetical protein [Bacillaceae bacterium]